MDHEKKKRKERLIVGLAFFFILEIFLVPFVVVKSLGYITSNDFFINTKYIQTIGAVFTQKNSIILYAFISIILLLVVFSFVTYTKENKAMPSVGVIQLSKKIFIPKPSGNFQHGNSRFMEDVEADEVYGTYENKTGQYEKEVRRKQ